MTVINILLVDDHTVLRQGIAQVIESQEDMHVVAQASNGEQAIEMAHAHQPDLMLLDINLPGIDGIEVARKISAELPDIRVLILTMHRQGEYVIESIKAGASGYLLKEVEMDEMLSAIRSVAQGDAVIDPSVANRVFENLRGEPQVERKSILNDLADRDIAILRLLGEGMSNKDIADQLHISEKTVRNRLSMVFKKFGLKNRTEAALFSVRKGLVAQDPE